APAGGRRPAPFPRECLPLCAVSQNFSAKWHFRHRRRGVVSSCDVSQAGVFCRGLRSVLHVRAADGSANRCCLSLISTTRRTTTVMLREKPQPVHGRGRAVAGRSGAAWRMLPFHCPGRLSRPSRRAQSTSRLMALSPEPTVPQLSQPPSLPALRLAAGG